MTHPGLSGTTAIVTGCAVKKSWFRSRGGSVVFVDQSCAARKLRRPRRIALTTSRWPLGGIEQWPGDYPRFETRLESRLSCPLVLRPSMPWPGQALVVGPGQAEPSGQGTISGEQALAKSASSPRPVPALGDDRVFAPHTVPYPLKSTPAREHHDVVVTLLISAGPRQQGGAGR